MKVAVIGLGAIGIQVLWQLSQTSGVEAHGFDRAYPGHPSAGAGGESRLYWNMELVEPNYTALIDRAATAWRKLESASNQMLRDPTGVLIYGREGDAQIQCAYKSSRELGVPYELFGVSRLREKFPQILFGQSSLGLWDTTGAVIRPERTIEVTAELARRHGASIHEFSPISKIDVSDDPVRILTATGWQVFDRVVVSCGGWSSKLVSYIRSEVVTRRLTSMWFSGFHDNHFTGFPPFLRCAPHYCYGIPSRDRRSVKLGLGFNNHYVSGDADRFPRQLEGGDLIKELKKFEWIQQEMLPGISRRPYRIDTFVESYTRSMLEHIRPHPQNSNVLVMTGFSGHGFRVSPAIGEIGCQLVINGKSDLDISFLERASPVFSILDPEQGITTENSVMTNCE